MDLGLNGKKAVVTGATRGIGRAIAQRLAEEGCDVAICARTAPDVVRTVKELEALGRRAFGQPLDAADGTALRGVVWRSTCWAPYGGVSRRSRTSKRRAPERSSS